MAGNWKPTVVPFCFLYCPIQSPIRYHSVPVNPTATLVRTVLSNYSLRITITDLLCNFHSSWIRAPKWKRQNVKNESTEYFVPKWRSENVLFGFVFSALGTRAFFLGLVEWTNLSFFDEINYFLGGVFSSSWAFPFHWSSAWPVSVTCCPVFSFLLDLWHSLLGPQLISNSNSSSNNNIQTKTTIQMVDR